MQKLNILPSLNVRLHINYQLQLPNIQYKKVIHCGNQIVSNTKITSMECKVRIFTFLRLGTLANFTIFRNLLIIFDYLSLALGYILQIWLTGLPFTIFAGLVNSTTLHNWVLVVLASLSIPSFPFLL